MINQWLGDTPYFCCCQATYSPAVWKTILSGSSQVANLATSRWRITKGVAFEAGDIKHIWYLYIKTNVDYIISINDVCLYIYIYICRLYNIYKWYMFIFQNHFCLSIIMFIESHNQSFVHKFWHHCGKLNSALVRSLCPRTGDSANLQDQ